MFKQTQDIYEFTRGEVISILCEKAGIDRNANTVGLRFASMDDGLPWAAKLVVGGAVEEVHERRKS